MPTKQCDNKQQKPIAQTLFLGASVASFNTSAGWGGQPSQLTVNLIEDDFVYRCAPNYQKKAEPPKDGMYNQFAGTNTDPFTSNFPLNHFHTCGGNAYIECFVDKITGGSVVESGPQATPLQNRIYPGKVYYKLDPKLGLVSDYWIKPDPGFFGYRTRIKENGTYDSAGENKHPNYKYDIIDTPVYFKMGDFTFGGLVQSWSRGINSSGRTFTVTVNSPQSILNSCYVIVDKFAGSLFGKSTQQSGMPNVFGSPKNYVGSAGIDYNFSDVYRGVLPNVFNVYGFLESFGTDNFGVAQNNENGMSANKILDALSVLTSLDSKSAFLLDSTVSTDGCIKRAFSPFGRIVARCMQREDYQSEGSNNLYGPITDGFNSFGVVNPFPLQAMANAANETKRCQFVLDLQDLIYSDPARTERRLPDDVRISGPIITVGELINQIAEQTGQDTFVEMVPIIKDGVLYHVIKVKTISRLKQPSTNLIENTIKELQCKEYELSSITTGKEKNEVASRAMLIGGQQQRLYQVKSYRLAYSQNNFVYNPDTRKFVNYYSLGNVTDNSTPATSPADQYGFGKIRFPNFNSTRNVKLNKRIGKVNGLTAKYIEIINDEDNVQKANKKDFSTDDPVWRTAELKDSIPGKYGNYEPSFKSSHNAINDPSSGGRWFPLYMDNICPFFGFIHDETLDITTNDQNQSSSDYRKIRPVWFDTWTGQIVVVIRISELPKLNVSLKKIDLDDSNNKDPFFLPYTNTIDPPATDRVFNTSGPVTSYEPIEFFVLTESEMRAALAGFDNFLVYSLSKTYKPDLIELVRRAYYMRTKKHLKTNLGVSEAEAKKLAFQETDWYWKLLGTNIGGDSLYPTPVFPDKNDGSQYIQEKALQDLKLIHKFVSDVAKYYGKKYMVKAHKLAAYKDETFTKIAFQTNVGYGYVFSGAGSLTYNYVPTNDGAWEEYGNIIDDSIVVGGAEWYAITDDVGKIKPLLGYNNNKNYDYIRANKCKAAAKQTTDAFNTAGVPNNGYFSFNSWLTLFEHKTSSCTDSFVFPSIDTTNLGSTDYIVVDQMYSNSNAAQAVQDSLIDAGITNVTTVSIPSLSITTQVKSYDAWGREITESGNPITRSKVYVTTGVDEGFVYLDPVTLSNPRILIDAPGINLSLSSEQHSKDPNRAVLPNVAIEDLLIYMKTHQSSSWDYNWIRYMLNYVCPVSFDNADNPHYLGLYTVSSNSASNNVELAPKAAHPFFAGIPIKSNQYVYGPWTNYPYAKWNDIFYDITHVKQSTPNKYPITCTSTSHEITDHEAKSTLDNLITNTSIEVRDDLVPWNYGSMNQLDKVVLQELETMINYQAVIETAQIDMPNLPLFDLGGVFSTNNIDLAYVPTTGFYRYTDKKNPSSTSLVDLSYIPGAIPVTNNTPTTVDADYTVVSISGSGNSDGPIISNIQSTIGQNGVTTTYSFRTYTRKLGLFNRESIERTKKMALMDMQRNKKLVGLRQEVQNVANAQRKFLLEERLNQSQFGSADLSSKLFGWSPGMVLVGQANPLIDEPFRTPKYIEDFSYYSNARGLNTKISTPSQWSLASSGLDPGETSLDKDPTNRLTTNSSATTLKNSGRFTSTVQLYQRKEVEAQIQTDYGMQSLMSLDGLLSPISFYPTHKNSTFAFSLFDTSLCPACNGTKVKTIKIAQYNHSGPAPIITDIKVVCDSCGSPKAKLNAIINTENADIPINAITLNPVVVPSGEFKNSNTQNYEGAHPKKAHEDISNQSPGLAGQPRRFVDRMRHCIEIVGRGSVPPNKVKYALETSRNLTAYTKHPNGVPSNNLDYYHKDEMLKYLRTKAGDTKDNILYEMNQRFFGLRGPLTLHSWGYDEEGYPVPNAADEPYAFDTYGRPKRFKLKKTVSSTTKPFKSLAFGEMFALDMQATGLYAKTFNYENLPTLPNKGDTQVYTVKLEDDYNVDGGFDPVGGANDLISGYKGSIISKTQKFNNGKWSEKIKLNEFYLNWAERPDLWKVGPIDLFWDSNRRVWTAGGGGEEQTPPYIVTNSNDIDSLDEFLNKKSTKNVPYRMIYATLEEDLVKQPDFDETFATRAFIDDVEFSKEPLLAGYRRLIYIKDKCGYCAPNGSKLLCRYNRFTGFYEPVTKPSVSAKGRIMNGNTAVIDATYIQGKRSTATPTLSVTFDNPLGFATPVDAIGIFMFLNGKWTLSAIKS